LGDNYDKYHAFLADHLASLGRPVVSDYKTVEEYARAWTAVEDVVHAEVTIRACRGFRRSGTPLDAPPSSPLIEPGDRLARVKD
jgi:hypothetical protein